MHPLLAYPSETLTISAWPDQTHRPGRVRPPLPLRRAVLARGPRPVHHLAPAPPGRRLRRPPRRLRAALGGDGPGARTRRSGRSPLAVPALGQPPPALRGGAARPGPTSWRSAAGCRALNRRQVSRLTPDRQAAHDAWQAAHGQVPSDEAQRRRGRHLALSLVELGEDREDAERQLLRWRYEPSVASDAAAWAWERHRSALDAAQDAAQAGSRSTTTWAPAGWRSSSTRTVWHAHVCAPRRRPPGFREVVRAASGRYGRPPRSPPDRHRDRQRAVLDHDHEPRPPAPRRRLRLADRVRPASRELHVHPGPGRGTVGARAHPRHHRGPAGLSPRCPSRPPSSPATRSGRRPRWSRLGPPAPVPTPGIVVFEHRAYNQRDELVCQARRTGLMRRHRHPTGHRHGPTGRARMTSRGGRGAGRAGTTPAGPTSWRCGTGSTCWSMTGAGWRTACWPMPPPRISPPTACSPASAPSRAGPWR